jgi:hypothetical protein
MNSKSVHTRVCLNRHNRICDAHVILDLDLHISFFDAKLTLLLDIAQTRSGAAIVFDAGLFQAVKASGLFSTDPDLGVGRFTIARSLKDY